MTLALAALLVSAACAPEALEVFPAVVTLEGPRDRQALVARRVDEAGLSTDRSDVVALRVADPRVARVDGREVLPVADGETVVVVAVDGVERSIPVRVVGAAAPIAPPSLRLDVLPVFSHAGCNAGGCHGSSRGQDGFRLSLFGFDPDADHRSIVAELPGRRVDLADPARSLLLTKATGAVAHTGGERFKADDPRYDTVRRWIEAGAPNDAPGVPHVVAIELVPPDLALACGTRQRMGVRARYSDGTDRDVTALATMWSSNDYAATVDASGVVSALHPGETHVLARYDACTVGAGAIVVDAAAPMPAQAAREPAPSATEGSRAIDAAVDEKLRRLRVTPSERCTDEEFLRRVTLDLCGTLPTPEECRRFLADEAPDRRRRVVDELLGRKEFAEIWVMKWAERLGIRSTLEVSPKAALLYATWLELRVAGRTPIDGIVRELLSAEGGTFDTPATNFYQLERDPMKLAENVAQAFLGTRIQCAQCHNHPFDRWTMDDYYGFVAFFAQVARKPGRDPRETVVFDGRAGESTHPIGGRAMPPTFLGGPVADVAGRDRRAALAAWLTSPDNRMFARNVANFVWAHFFHRGIVEPVDDVRASNPPVNEALLDALATSLVRSSFQLEPFVRDICLSETYQRSVRPPATGASDEANFSRAVPRRIRAEFLLDAISRVTGTKDKFDGLPLGARAIEIADGTTSTYFLSTFGRATRQTVCTCEVRAEPSLSQALHLLNGDTVHEKIRQGNVVRTALGAGATPGDVLDDLFLRTLARRPSDAERAALLAPIAEGVDPAVALEDALWALCNSREFLFNH